jgi:CofD-related protein of GAK system
MQRLIRNQIGYFHRAMPPDFDLRGASVGNLILSGGYLNNHFHLDPIIFLFSKLVEARGTVRAVVNDNLHLAAELQDGSRVIGQHLLTGKETAPLTSPIKRLQLCEGPGKFVAANSTLRKRNRKLIEGADLICFAPGSFYTSLIANLLPKGVGSAVAASTGPRVYIPNLGTDPEQLGMNMNQAVTTLLDYLRADLNEASKDKKLLDFILIDSKRGDYGSQLSGDLMAELGIQVLDTRLISEQSTPWYDPELLIAALLSLT